MKKSVIGALLLGSVSLVALSAHASEPEGFYVGANGGLNFNDTLKTDLDPTAAGAGGSINKLKSHEGWGGSAEVGYNWGNNIRTEIEGAYSQNEMKDEFGLATSGRTDAWRGYVNAFYDFDLTQYNIALPIVPYLGAGIGAVNWGQQATYPQALPNTPHISGNGTAFSYQAIGGVAYNIDDNWAATVDYRHINTPTLEFGKNRPSLHHQRPDFRAGYGRCSLHLLATGPQRRWRRRRLRLVHRRRQWRRQRTATWCSLTSTSTT